MLIKKTKSFQQKQKNKQTTSFFTETFDSTKSRDLFRALLIIYDGILGEFAY